MKIPYKVMALSTLIATITAGSITPSYASAAENTTKPAPIYADAANKYPDYPEYSLAPEGLKEALKKTGSNMLVMDLYALTIIKQANITFDGVTTINNDLQTNMKNNQEVARTNAKKWLDSLKPQIIQTNQNIINYNTEFQNYYDTLVEAANNKDKETIKAVLQELIASIKNNKEKSNKLVEDLIEFREKISKDTHDLKENSGKITGILADEKRGIPDMKKQIETNYKLIDENNKVYIASSVSTALGAFLTSTIILAPLGAGPLGGGIYGVVSSKQQINDAYEEIKKLQTNISNSEQQVGKLTILENDTKNLTETIDAAITAVENVKDQWVVMGTKYESLLQNVDKISGDQLAIIIKNKLNTAKTSWEQVSEYAQKIQNSEIKFVEAKK
ncbi:enterotoxin [Bacillus wiedmannii]|uniref:non-hemolytic enterotoxin subunit B n=1 Tax=Bacillus TaxID=1386 RepID=UPI0007CB4DB2|nr:MULTISPECIES: HBL/NHE enterotoxin family protein [Bacillus cereus group]OAK29159.1 enterotoxin [Bacillus wiedmannii]OAK37757.1 enterotoxin [Bacillus wiedmannii]OAK41161.1 enterotoxin [Bacillus wiedmannii]OFD58803.1 hemolytic enterotoxin [Bacillus mycoides]HDR7642122.1 alpha-helical pore-forming toxin family protein [Bacillus wiedmannii]